MDVLADIGIGCLLIGLCSLAVLFFGDLHQQWRQRAMDHFYQGCLRSLLAQGNAESAKLRPLH